MSDELIELEEEEFTSNLTAPVFRRILGLFKPHWKWLTGFLIAISVTSALDGFFTYLTKQIVDQGITLKDPARVYEIATLYGAFILVQAVTEPADGTSETLFGNFPSYSLYPPTAGLPAGA